MGELLLCLIDSVVTLMGNFLIIIGPYCFSVQLMHRCSNSLLVKHFLGSVGVLESSILVTLIYCLCKGHKRIFIRFEKNKNKIISGWLQLGGSVSKAFYRLLYLNHKSWLFSHSLVYSLLWLTIYYTFQVLAITFNLAII